MTRPPEIPGRFRSPTRGDLRYEYLRPQEHTKRRRTNYSSQLNPQDSCSRYDLMGRLTQENFGCDGTIVHAFYYDGDFELASACPSSGARKGLLTLQTGSGGGTDPYWRALCYHPNGMTYASFLNRAGSWSNTLAKGTSRIHDLNLNVAKEYLHDRPDGHTYAREALASVRYGSRIRRSSV